LTCIRRRGRDQRWHIPRPLEKHDLTNLDSDVTAHGLVERDGSGRFAASGCGRRGEARSCGRLRVADRLGEPHDETDGEPFAPAKRAFQFRLTRSVPVAEPCLLSDTAGADLVRVTLHRTLTDDVLGDRERADDPIEGEGRVEDLQAHERTRPSRPRSPWWRGRPPNGLPGVQGRLEAGGIAPAPPPSRAP